ncbi:MAG: hypothetical protein EPN37_00655 [Chitinophagaceae bacterium]|nr:MAG: hypothetical protein EPN37_00655 [Chitinophagaceae bacterium]
MSYKSKLVLPILAVIAGVAASAFTVARNNSKIEAGTYWYTYTGTSQSVTDRSNKANYTNPASSEPSCPGAGNECAVQVQGITGTPPSDLTTLSITFDPNTGMPDGGNNFSNNAQKR